MGARSHVELGDIGYGCAAASQSSVRTTRTYIHESRKCRQSSPGAWPVPQLSGGKIALPWNSFFGSTTQRTADNLGAAGAKKCQYRITARPRNVEEGAARRPTSKSAHADRPNPTSPFGSSL